jgi:uncharacterized protein YbbC (DUF1343 family)
VSIPGVSLRPPQEGKRCRGEDLRGFYNLHPEKTGRIILQWLITAYACWKGNKPFFTDYFDTLAGTDQLRKQLGQGISEEEIRRSWRSDLNKFNKIRKKYLLY